MKKPYVKPVLEPLSPNDPRARRLRRMLYVKAAVQGAAFPLAAWGLVFLIAEACSKQQGAVAAEGVHVAAEVCQELVDGNASANEWVRLGCKGEELADTVVRMPRAQWHGMRAAASPDAGDAASE